MNVIYPGLLPIAHSLTAYNAFLTGLFVLFKRRDRAGFYYFIANFIIFLWGVGISFMLNNDLSETVAKKWGVFSQIAALFIPAIWLHFVLIYTEQVNKFKKLLFFIYLSTLAIFPFTFTPYFVSGFREMVKIKFYPMPGPVYVIFTILFAVVVFYSFLSFLIVIKNTSSEEKKKDYRLVCLAWLYGFGMGSLSFLPVYGIPFPQYNLLAMPLWQILLAYAMTRYHIFNLEEILRAARKDKLAAIGTLVTSINHEVRNPLYVVQGLAQTYLEKFNEGIYSTKEAALDKAVEILRKTNEQATRAIDIMKRFAMLAKQDLSHTIKTEKINLDETLENILLLVRHELELDQIEMRKNIQEGISALQVDKRHIEEILFNLIVNACQAIKLEEKREGVIEIKAKEIDGHVNVLIKDNGPGMKPDQVSKIFEPFYTTKEQGTGLGLYVTRQLVEKNGGKISVTSKPGIGSEFTLRFPRIKKDGVAE